MAVEAVYCKVLSGRQPLLTGKIAGNSTEMMAKAKSGSPAFITVFARIQG
jgi:hypothetical protein